MGFDREKRFRKIAEQRLLLYPDAYSTFIGQMLYSGRPTPGWQLVHLAFLQDTASHVAMLQFHPKQALEDFDRRVVSIVDEWVATNLEDPIQPLVLAARPPSPAKTNAAPPTPARRKRADLLTPVIERAQAQANDPTNHSEVFAILRTWATSNDKPAPVIGYAESDGMQWLDGSDKVRWLNLAALRKRINRPPVAAKGR